MSRKIDKILLINILSYVLILLISSISAQEKMIRYSSGAKNTPWGVALSSNGFGDYPKFNPILRNAGVIWIHYFPKWNIIQPTQKRWNWKVSDPFIVNARKNRMKVIGSFAYFADKRLGDHSFRTFTEKDIPFWQEYVKEVTERYKNDITTWEIAFPEIKNITPAMYAKIVINSYNTAKKTDPNLRIGINCSNLDLQFLDAVIKSGAADHFDFISMQLYDNLLSIIEDNGESDFLTISSKIRKILKNNRQKKKIKLLITGIGYPLTNKRELAEKTLQAEAIVKAYTLSIAQGFQHIYWYEPRGDIKTENNYGLIKDNWVPRPAYYALKTMISLLGKDPIYLGWLKTGKEGYGFLFHGTYSKILIAWSRIGEKNHLLFSTPVTTQNIRGEKNEIPANKKIMLTKEPILIYNLPENYTKKADINLNKPFPWKINYWNSPTASCRLAATNIDLGIEQINPHTTKIVNEQFQSYRETTEKQNSMSFLLNSAFTSASGKNLKITIVAKCADINKSITLSMFYESLKGYVYSKEQFKISKQKGWHSYTWTVKDANFIGGWGWNIRINAKNQKALFDIKKITVQAFQE
jgi:hypothetical protein